MKRFLFLRVTALLILSSLWGGIVHAQSRSGKSEEQRGFTFCAYNLKNYLRMERFVQGQRTELVPKPEKEIEAVLRFLGEIQPDILGVCEIGDEQDLKDLQERLKERGLDLPHVEHSRGGDPTRRLALLSRYPIVARDSQQDLKYQIGGAVYPVQRGILDATVQVRPGFALRCLGVHFKSKREVPEGDQALMRRNEAHLLRRHVESILTDNPETRLLAYGDFNEHRNEAAILEIEGALSTPTSLTDIRLEDSRGETWTHAWEAADSYARLDYIFVSKPLLPYVNRKASHLYDAPDFRDGSDHRPLVLKIDMSKSR